MADGGEESASGWVQYISHGRWRPGWPFRGLDKRMAAEGAHKSSMHIPLSVLPCTVQIPLLFFSYYRKAGSSSWCLPPSQKWGGWEHEKLASKQRAETCNRVGCEGQKPISGLLWPISSENIPLRDPRKDYYTGILGQFGTMGHGKMALPVKTTPFIVLWKEKNR